MALAPRAMVPEMGQVSMRRPSTPHVHFRGGGDEVFPLPEVHQRAVGGGVALLQPPVELRGRRGAGLEEGLAGHHLEEVAAPERLDRRPDRRRVLPRSMVAFPIGHASGRVGRPGAGAGEAGGVPATRLELVAVARRGLAPVVHDEDVVGEEQHEVAFVPVARGWRAGSDRTGTRARSRTRRRNRDVRPRGCGRGR